MSKKKEKRIWIDRKEKRFEEENKVVIEWEKYNDPRRNHAIYAFTQNLSIEGARILTDINFPIDTVFRITLTLSRSKQIVNIKAKVIWVNPVFDGDLFEVGMEFIHEQPRTITCLLKHLFGKDLPTNLAAKIIKAENKTANSVQRKFKKKRILSLME